MLKCLTVATALLTAISVTSANAASHHGHGHRHGTGVTGASNALPPLSYTGALAPFGLANHVTLPIGNLDLTAAADETTEPPAQLANAEPVEASELAPPAELAPTPAPADAGTIAASNAPTDAPPQPQQSAPSLDRNTVPAGFFAPFDESAPISASAPAETEVASADVTPVAEEEMPAPDARALPRERDEHLASMIRAHTVRRAPAPEADTETADAAPPALSFQLRR